MSGKPEIRLDIPDRETFDRLVADPLPLGLESRDREHAFHRDVYFDTADRALDQRGARLRFRIRADDRRFLSLRIKDTGGGASEVRSDERFDAEVAQSEPAQALVADSAPARRLRAFVNPTYLDATVELETERFVRRSRGGLLRKSQFELRYDIVTVRGRGRVGTFRELKIRRLRQGPITLEQLSRAFQDTYGLRTLLTSKAERANQHLSSFESDDLTKVVQESRESCLVAIVDRRLALVGGDTLAVPVGNGSGEDAARRLMQECFGTPNGRIRLLGIAAASASRPSLEVWLVERLSRNAGAEGNTRWVVLDEVMARVGSPVLRDPRTLAALAVAAHANLLPVRPSGEYPADGIGGAPLGTATPEATSSAFGEPDLPDASLDAEQPVPEHYVNEQLSWLEFNSRVLELAEDPGVPLLARLHFLSIFSANLDEFFMVRIGALKHAIASGVQERSSDGLSPQEELDAIRIRLSPLVARQQRCFRRACLPELARRGITVKTWGALTSAERENMVRYFHARIFPVLTPQAMTRAPGHPFPRMTNLRLSLAVMIGDSETETTHFAHVRMPEGVPRFVQTGDGDSFVPIEELVTANLQALYPGRTIEAAHPFRITRAGDIQVDEEQAASLLDAVEQGVKRRPFGTVVRIEVAHDMPEDMRSLLQRELSFEGHDQRSMLSGSDLVEVEGLVHLGDLAQLADLPHSDLAYPPFEARDPLAAEESILDAIRSGDRLVHHPYDSFQHTVQRFIVEAAGDPDVVAIKMTLYRSGQQSAIIDALTHATRAGKDVSVFVELKARFDEERNIHWAKKLEAAGIHVVTGLVRLKTHAKIALVVRREGDAIRRYVHVGTGNYNAITAKFYTDLGLLTCNDELGADLNALFNQLTGSSTPPGDLFSDLLVAPNGMLDKFAALIAREADHAREGRPARIRLKLNGLADREMVAALYQASQAGVQIDLIVRGICILRPGVPGLSERIRVYSILGRFLEHARIYHFANGGDDEYFIGSADWRPRNLRRRVEVVAPVRDEAVRRRLDEILEVELEDPMAWTMRSDGSYRRGPRAVGVDCVTAQEHFIAAR